MQEIKQTKYDFKKLRCYKKNVCKKQEFTIIENAIRIFVKQFDHRNSNDFEKKSISIILQFDQRYIQQIEIFNRNLSNSYN